MVTRLHVGTVPVDVVRAEVARFRHPLLLLHGLWTGAWIWRGAASYLAHRGWESWTPDLGGRLDADVATVSVALSRVAAALPAAPIVVTHASSAVVGTMLAQAVGAPAVVVLAPILPGPEHPARRGLFGFTTRWRARAASSSLAPPPAMRDAVGDFRSELRADSAALYRSLANGALALPAAAPAVGLVASGARDMLSPDAAGALLARRFGWDHRVWPAAGHLALAEHGWERLADDVHRWIVRALGENLLSFLDEEH